MRVQEILKKLLSSPPPNQGSPFNTSLQDLKKKALSRGHEKLAELYDDFIRMNLPDSDAVVERIQSINSQSPTRKERELLNRILSIGRQNGFGAQLDISGEAAAKRQAIRQASCQSTEL